MFPMKLSVSLKSTVTTHKFPIILHSAGSHCALQGAHSRRGQSMYRKSKKAGVQGSCHRTRDADLRFNGYVQKLSVRAAAF